MAVETNLELLDTTSVGSRVNWGALLAGTCATLACLWLLWLLGFGSTLAAVRRPDDLNTAAIALVVIMVLSTLVGCAVGGLMAGRMQRTGFRRLGSIHGMLSGCLSFLVMLAGAMMLFGWLMRAAGGTVATTAQAAVSATGEARAAPGGVTSGTQRFLEGLGFSAGEARQMTVQAQQGIQSLMRGPNRPTAEQAGQALNTLFDYFGAVILGFMVTWLVGIGLSMACGALGAVWVERERRAYLPRREPIVEPGQPLTTPPFQPTT